MKFVGYDCFNTARIRFEDGTVEDVAIMQDVYGDDWWHGDYESYLFNMIEAMFADGALKNEPWETMMVVMTDWTNNGFDLHTFHLVQGENDICHEVHHFNE